MSVERVAPNSPQHAAVFAPDEGRPVLEGYLDKYASNFPFNWKTRYFELGFDGVLRYYTAE